MNTWKWMDEHAEEAVLGLLLAAMSCVLLLQIVMRYAFHASLPWPEELSRYLFVIMGFLSIPYCMRKGVSLKVDIIVSLMPEGVRNVMNMMAQILEIMFYLFLFYYSFPVLKSFMQSGEVTPAMKLPVWMVYALICVSLGLGVLRGIQRLVLDRIKGKNETNAVSYEKEGEA